MHRIEYIRSATSGRFKLSVSVFDVSEAYVISAAMLNSLSAPYKGGMLTEDELESVRIHDEEYRATKKALSMLAYSDKNTRTLLSRLRAHGFSEHSARYAVEYCLEQGYIDERRQLERLVLAEANGSLRGRLYIMRKLAAKGYSRTEIAQVIDGLVASGQIDFENNLKRLFEKKGASDGESRRALIYKYGYGGIND